MTVAFEFSDFFGHLANQVLAGRVDSFSFLCGVSILGARSSLCKFSFYIPEQAARIFSASDGPDLLKTADRLIMRSLIFALLPTKHDGVFQPGKHIRGAAEHLQSARQFRIRHLRAMQ